MSDELSIPNSLESRTTERYLDLLKIILTRSGLEPDVTYHEVNIARHPGYIRWPARLVQWALGRGSMQVMGVRPYDASLREQGVDRPQSGETMIGLRRLDNLQTCLSTVIQDRIPGDVLEAGVWRGGASIFMRAVLVAHGEGHRQSWLADSFRGLPVPDAERYPEDVGAQFHTYRELAVSRAEVEANFERFGLLDEGVHFLEGWFRDTLPTAPVRELSLLRLDGDMYESTLQTLDALYERVVSGGFVVVDDYAIAACRQATDKFRARHGIRETIEQIDWTGVFWRKA